MRRALFFLTVAVGLGACGADEEIIPASAASVPSPDPMVLDHLLRVNRSSAYPMLPQSSHKMQMSLIQSVIREDYPLSIDSSN